MHISQRGAAWLRATRRQQPQKRCSTALLSAAELQSALHNLTNSRDRKDAWRGCLAEKAGKRKLGAFGEHETVKKVDA